MNCSNCKNPLPSEASFCVKCGESVKGLPSENLIKKNNMPVMKCGSCDYVGEAESNRSLWAQILAWICLLGFWIITIIYFATTRKYRCPKCKSTFIGIKDTEGKFADQKSSALKIILFAVLGISLIAILSTIILASLGAARQKAVQQEHPIGWTTYNAISDKFSVLVPHSPSFESSSDITSDGIPYEIHIYSIEEGSKFYMISKYIYSEPIDVSNPDNLLEKILNSFLTGSGSKLTTSNYLEYKTYRSLDFTSITTDNNTFKGRILLVKETPYLLILGYPTNNNNFSNYNEFVDSFEIK